MLSVNFCPLCNNERTIFNTLYLLLLLLFTFYFRKKIINTKAKAKAKAKGKMYKITKWLLLVVLKKNIFLKFYIFFNIFVFLKIFRKGGGFEIRV